jgi:predicted ATPase
LHAQIAEALETHSPEIVDSQPELLAQHYAEAGLVETSATYWGTAGRRSVVRSAMAEAAAQFQKALDQLALLSDTSERGYVLLFLGYPDRALAQSTAAIVEARRLVHAPSLVLTLGCGAMLLLLIGENAVFCEWVDQMIAVAAEQDFPFWRAYGTICRGWIKVKSGDVTQGVSLLRSGLAAYRASGAETYMPHHIALLARACETRRAN